MAMPNSKADWARLCPKIVGCGQRLCAISVVANVTLNLSAEEGSGVVDIRQDESDEKSVFYHHLRTKKSTGLHALRLQEEDFILRSTEELFLRYDRHSCYG